MSGTWEPFRSALEQQPGVELAGIFSAEGATWSRSERFKVSPKELAALVLGMDYPKRFESSGVVCAGVTFNYKRHLDRNTFVAQLSANAVSLVVHRTKRLLLVVTTKPRTSIEDARAAIAAAAKQMGSYGF